MKVHAFRAGLFAGLVSTLALEAHASDAWPTPGGEGGAVVEVSSLADQGPGTLREALGRDGARRIVFKVAGEIVLSRPLQVGEPYVTIAGETAPEPGITILGDKLRITTHDVVVSNLRMRVGEVGNSKPENRDGISIEGAKDGERVVKRILIQNCSIAWAIDEGLSVWGEGVSDVLVRDTIVAETLRGSIHPKGEHSMGVMVGPGVENVVLQRNLFASNAWRNPVVHGGAGAMIVNNLIYNPRYAALHFYPHKDQGATRVSAVGNVVVPGPDTKGRLRALEKGINAGSMIFYADNMRGGTGAFDPSEPLPEGVVDSPMVNAAPLWFDDIDVLPASAVEATVLRQAGARPMARDQTDVRIAGEVAGRTGRIKDHPTDPRLVRDPQ